MNEIVISLAPSRAAVSTLAARSASELELAATRTILQLWQIPWTVSTLSAASTGQSPLAAGSGPECPAWLTTRRQRLATLQRGKPNCALNRWRSRAIVGPPYGSTTATVWRRLTEAGRWYRP